MDDVIAWLHKWQALINQGDIDAARPLFADDVVAYGSLINTMEGKSDLVRRQWSAVWPRIKNFTFDLDHIHVFGKDGEQLVVVAVPWHSLGRRADGWYDRRGRASLVLRRTADGYVCQHSHFSMEPGIPAIAD